MSFMRVTMQLWRLQRRTIVANWKKWKSLHERIWTTMPWTGISLVAASTGQVILLRSREILRLPVRTLQPSQRPFIWRMTFIILSETHGNVMLLLLTMRQIWTVQMAWVRFVLLRVACQIVHRVWRRQALFRWPVWLHWQMQIRARWLQLYRQSTQRWPTGLSPIRLIVMVQSPLLIKIVRPMS